MGSNSDISSEDDDDDVYTGAAARLKALRKRKDRTVDSLDHDVDSDREITPASTSAPTPKAPGRVTRSSCKALSRVRIDAEKRVSPEVSSVVLDRTISDSDEDYGNYTMNVKVRWKSTRIVHLELDRREPFDKIFTHFAELEGASKKRILILRGDKPLLPTDTPESVNLTVIDILDGGIVSADIVARDEPEIVDTCRIKVQTSTKERIEIDLGRSENFSRVASACAEKLNVSPSRIKLSFDGDVIGPNDTPDTLDLEEEACVDLCPLAY